LHTSASPLLSPLVQPGLARLNYNDSPVIRPFSGGPLDVEALLREYSEPYVEPINSPLENSSVGPSRRPSSKLEEKKPSLHILNIDRDKIHVLFGGTKVVRARTAGHLKVVCVVLRTSFATAKGQLVRCDFVLCSLFLFRSILYPKPTRFKFYEDSFKFVAVMGVIAFFGFVGNAIMQIKYNEAWEDIVLNAGDLGMNSYINLML
jgi:magnesium-transporting ATPase (P-type)